MEATIPYGKAVTVKSVEQRMIEKAAYEFASKMKAILGDKASARISIDGAPLSKIATIAEFMRDDEGDKVQIVRWDDDNSHVLYFSHKEMKGEGFKVESIRE